MRLVNRVDKSDKREEGYDYALELCERSVCVEVCGDGVRTASEGCDDGNLMSDEGCSSQCSVECRYDGRTVWTTGSPIHSNESVAAAGGGTVEPLIEVPQVPQKKRRRGKQNKDGKQKRQAMRSTSG